MLKVNGDKEQKNSSNGSIPGVGAESLMPPSTFGALGRLSSPDDSANSNRNSGQASLMPPGSLFGGGSRSVLAAIPSITGSVGAGGVNNSADVKTVQNLLNNNNAGLIVDGLIGPNTIGAIQNFQLANFGWSDGRVDVGGQTWGALSNQANTTETASGDGGGSVTGDVITPPPVVSVPTSNNLFISASVGSGGQNLPQDVVIIQTLLNNHGAGLVIDGLIGPNTINAIINFQFTNFGWADGRVDAGGQTLTALTNTPSTGDTTLEGNTGANESQTPAPTVPGTSGENSSVNDILFELNTTGAGVTSTQQDGNFNDFGAAASSRMAKTDEERIIQYAAFFKASGEQFGFPPALLAAIASRETRGRNLLFGDHGNGVGFMQIDQRFHPERAANIRNAATETEQVRLGIETGAVVLSEMLAAVKQMHPDWSEVWQLRGAVSAYNSGPNNVQTQAGIDFGTTHNDYSADVWERAKYYASMTEFGILPNPTTAPTTEQPTTTPTTEPTTTAPTNGEPGTANFSLNEFHSKDGTPVPVELYPNIQKLMNNLEVLRTHLGNSAITISSGYRSPEHNASIENAAPNSRHLLGEAADIVVQNHSPNTVQETALQLIDQGLMDEGGLGRYNTFTHYDIRGWAARWDNR